MSPHDTTEPPAGSMSDDWPADEPEIKEEPEWLHRRRSEAIKAAEPDEWANTYQALTDDTRTTGTPGVVPPHNLEAEASLLGSMILSEAARDAAGQITADDFYRPAHGHIYAAIRELGEAGQGVDTITVCAQLAGLLDAVGGPAAVATLTAEVPATSNAATYAAIVRDASRRRKQMRVADELKALALDGHKTADCVGMLEDLEGQTGTSHAVRLGDTLDDYLDLVEARSDGTAPSGIPTGLPTLDTHTGGFRGGQLITVCARPGHGKSDFACQVVNNTAASGTPTLIVSIEMGMEELQDRWMAQASHIKHSRLRAGEIAARDWTQITEGVSRLVDIPLYVHDDPGANLATIRYQARRIPGIGLIVVDYLQLMDSIGSHENRQTEVAALSRGLKRLARDLEVPVIALAQLNRGVEMRHDKRPVSADLRESGAIEQDSDIVLALYRDELYNKDSKDAGIMEAIILKQRAGARETVRLMYDPTTSTIKSQTAVAA